MPLLLVPWIWLMQRKRGIVSRGEVCRHYHYYYNDGTAILGLAAPAVAAAAGKGLDGGDGGTGWLQYQEGRAL